MQVQDCVFMVELSRDGFKWDQDETYLAVDALDALNTWAEAYGYPKQETYSDNQTIVMNDRQRVRAYQLAVTVTEKFKG